MHRLDSLVTIGEASKIRKVLLNLLKTNPTKNNWLHRRFRKQYLKGHSYVSNQIVYQNAGYSCKRINRSSVQLEIAGLVKGKRIKCSGVLSVVEVLENFAENIDKY